MEGAALVQTPAPTATPATIRHDVIVSTPTLTEFKEFSKAKLPELAIESFTY